MSLFIGWGGFPIKSTLSHNGSVKLHPGEKAQSHLWKNTFHHRCCCRCSCHFKSPSPPIFTFAVCINSSSYFKSSLMANVVRGANDMDAHIRAIFKIPSLVVGFTFNQILHTQLRSASLGGSKFLKNLLFFPPYHSTMLSIMIENHSRTCLPLSHFTQKIQALKEKHWSGVVCRRKDVGRLGLASVGSTSTRVQAAAAAASGQLKPSFPGTTPSPHHPSHFSWIILDIRWQTFCTSDQPLHLQLLAKHGFPFGSFVSGRTSDIGSEG